MSFTGPPFSRSTERVGRTDKTRKQVLGEGCRGSHLTRTAETDALSNILAANTAMHWVLLLTAFCRCQRPPRSPVWDAVWGEGAETRSGPTGRRP